MGTMKKEDNLWGGASGLFVTACTTGIVADRADGTQAKTSEQWRGRETETTKDAKGNDECEMMNDE